MRVKALAAAVILGVSSITIPTANAVASIPPPTSLPLTGQPQKFTLLDGSTVEVGPDGMGVHTSKDGKHSFRFSAIGPQASSLYGDKPGSNRDTLIKQFSVKQHGTASPGTVIVALSSATVDGAAVASPKGHSLRAAHTTDTRVNATLQAVGAKTAESLLGAVPAERVGAMSSGAAKRLGSGALDLSKVYVMDVTGSSADEAAKKLRATPGVAYAEPDLYVHYGYQSGEVASLG